MFYHLSLSLQENLHAFNLFRYITFRSIAALLTSFLVAFLLGPKVINWLKHKQKEGQPIRLDGPEQHLLTKKGTPTMGGCLILLALSIGTLLWSDLTNAFVWITLILTLSYGAIGAYDDYLKLTKRSSKGLRGTYKFLLQSVFALIASIFIASISQASDPTSLTVPFFKHVIIHWGIFFYIFSTVVIVGASNAVNLTDGLDGLAIVPVMMVSGCFALIAYLIGNAVFSHYLQITHVPQAGEIAIFCASLVGAGLGFLWYNAPPAKIFMGDTGSLAAGGALGTIAVITKHEIVLAIMGGIFVLETVSVILQVISYKRFKKRIFLMAPIHHHFEKKGWAEATIVIRFWIISALLVLIGLSTLKLR
jgi:phospho-N-acetylmuramoyl-pentapeptide-transferase